MAKLTLQDIVAGYKAKETINENNAATETALENTLSRDGTGPNEMEANLDMNSYRILNLPNAVQNQEPITLAQAGSIAGVTNPLTQEIIGSYLYPATEAETTAAVTPTYYSKTAGPIIDMERYGAVDGSGNGAANDSAIADALAVLDAVSLKGGTLQFGKGTYYFDSPIDLSYLWGITLQGVGGVSGGASPGTILMYTGTGTRFIDMRGALGVFLDRLDIQWDNASFSGTLVDAGNDGSHDSFRCGMKRCNLGCSVGSGVLLLDLDKAIEFVADECHFMYGDPAVQGLATGGSYSNVITFRDCVWTNSRSIPIARPGETWAFYSCTFEQRLNGAAGAIDSGSTSTPGIGLTLDNCWLGDVTASGGTWIYYSGKGLNIRGCRITGSSYSSTYAVSLATVYGFVIEGNQFQGFTAVLNFADSGSRAGSFRFNNLDTNTATFSNGSNAPPDAQFIHTPNYPEVSADPTAASLTSYTPAWTGASSDPAIGDGSLTGYYTRHGRMITAAVRLVIGSTTTFGSGAWSFSLPFTPAPTLAQVGQAYVLDSGTNYRTGSVRTTTDSSGKCQVIIDSDSAVIDSGRPMTWANGDELHFSITYLT